MGNTQKENFFTTNFYKFLVVFFVLVLAGCGSGGGGATPEPPIEGGVPETIVLTHDIPPGSQLIQGGEAMISATAYDVNNELVPDGNIVNFTADKGIIPSQATTIGGVAKVTYQAGLSAGMVTITATLPGDSTTTQTTNIDIANGPSNSIIVSTVLPTTIGIQGSGIEDTSLIAFSVRDTAGNPASDGTTVNFTLSTSVNGGESLSAESAQTADGFATVALQSGNVPGTVAIRASIDKGDGTFLVTEARVTIVSNRPDAGRITMGASILNLAGGVTLGLQSKVSAYIGDRAGNVVPDGWPVSFISECGTIGTSGGFDTSTELGVASATFQTSAPAPANLIGDVAPWGEPGLCRLVAYTPGKGNFQDLNANGLFDGSDVCVTVMDEPYIDSNDSGAHETGEYYVDVSNNGQFDTNVVDCIADSMIWTSMNLMVSDYAAPLILTPSVFNITQGASESFLLTLEDILGNALVAGTVIDIKTDGGTLLGQTSYTMPDVVASGGTFSFSLASDDGDPKFATVTATLSPAAGENNNGAEIFDVAAGMINLALPVPSVPSITLDTGVPVGAQLAQGESITLTAIIFKADGELAEDDTLVTFSASNGILAPTGAPTFNGIATTIFTAPNFGGPVDLTANALGVSGLTDVIVSAGDASTIIINSITPTQIGVRGSGLADTSTITFDVLDQVGNPAIDGALVYFTQTAFTGGGERLSSESAQSVNGQVRVVLQSGIRSGTVEIAAVLDNNTGSDVATTARVVIAAGLPDAKHFSLAASPLNLPGFLFYNEQSLITAFLADRYSNPVPLATPIFFESEAGAMALEDLTGSNLGNNETDKAGQAFATHITQAPTPDTAEGRSTILAWTLGSESFVDLNGNGSFDSGEPFGDLEEPYIDANGNGSYDEATNTTEEERYVDLNLDNIHNGPNGEWDERTFVWTTIDVLWSGATAIPTISPDTFDVADKGSQTFTITAADINGHPLPQHTSIDTRLECQGIGFATALLEGDVSVVLGDSTYSGAGTTEFTVIAYNRLGSYEDSTCALIVDVAAPKNGSTTANIAGTLRQEEIAPVAVDDEITALQDTDYISGAFEKLVRNDTDQNDDVLTVIPGVIETNAGGSLNLATDGSFIYTPPAGFTGNDFVDYTVTDGTSSIDGLRTDVGTLDITVTP